MIVALPTKWTVLYAMPSLAEHNNKIRNSSAHHSNMCFCDVVFVVNGKKKRNGQLDPLNFYSIWTLDDC